MEMGEMKCLLCSETTTIKLHLDDLDSLECDSCGDTFSVESVEQAIAGWEKAIAIVNRVKKEIENQNA